MEVHAQFRGIFSCCKSTLLGGINKGANEMKHRLTAISGQLSAMGGCPSTGRIEYNLFRFCDKIITVIQRTYRTLLSLVMVYVFLTGTVHAADAFAIRRQEMVRKDIESRGIQDKKVLDAMLKVPRHLFVDKTQIDKAYNDHPLPIGEGQTISQPYVVALMTEAVSLKGGERVLEIGTGSGYQAAVLAEIVGEVFTIEIKKGLYETVQDRLKSLGYGNIQVKHGDGYFGWEAHAPFDVIMVTASANHIPPPLLAQLKEGGRLIIPLGSTVFFQTLTLVKKEKGKFPIKELGSVAFVPMTGQAQKK
jgi:protein-L-isoaspartate(D-aspartate) O-methyltransferase